jgi:hypothetical protein
LNSIAWQFESVDIDDGQWYSEVWVQGILSFWDGASAEKELFTRMGHISA